MKIAVTVPGLGRSALRVPTLLGARPVSGVLLPAGFPVVLWIASYRTGSFAEVLASSIFAFVALCVLYACLQRRPWLLVWLGIPALVLAVADVFSRSTATSTPTLLVASALCASICTRERRPDHPAHEAALAVAGLSLVVGVPVSPRSWLAAGVAVGFGAAVLVVADVPKRWGLQRGLIGGRLVAQMVITTMMLLVAFRLQATQPVIIGALFGLAALVAAGEHRGGRVAAVFGLIVLGALTAPDGQFLVVELGILAVISGSVAIEPRDDALGRAALRWSATAPWIAIVVLIVCSLGLLLDELQSVSNARSRPPGGANLVELALGLMVVAAVVPWPERFARAIHPDRSGEVLVRSVTRGLAKVRDVCDRGDQRVVERCARRTTRRPNRPLKPPIVSQSSGFLRVIAVVADYAVPATLWLLGSVVVSNLASAASRAGGRLPIHLTPTLALGDPFGRVGWGTGDYWAIADHGYRVSEHREAFLPFLPLVLRAVRAVTGLPLQEVQTLVASISGLAAVLLLWKWAKFRGFQRSVRTMATVLFLVFPWNFLLFGYGYADATVTALVLGAFVLLDRRRMVLAAVVGSLAAATRPNGIPIVFAILAVEALRVGAVSRTALPAVDSIFGGSRLEVSPRKFGAKSIVVSLVSLSTLLAFSAWMWHHVGDPLYWFTIEQYYGHEPLTQLAAWLETLLSGWPSEAISGPHEMVNQWFTAAVTLGSLLAIPAIRRRFGIEYAIFAVLVWIMAWTGSRVFTPAGRLIMPITPFLFVLAAEWLIIRPWRALGVISACTVGSLTLVVLFTRGGNLWVGW